MTELVNPAPTLAIDPPPEQSHASHDSDPPAVDGVTTASNSVLWTPQEQELYTKGLSLYINDMQKVANHIGSRTLEEVVAYSKTLQLQDHSVEAGSQNSNLVEATLSSSSMTAQSISSSAATLTTSTVPGWTLEELRLFEEGLSRYRAPQFNELARFVKIAALVRTKSVRDVAQRVRAIQRLATSPSPPSISPGSPQDSSCLGDREQAPPETVRKRSSGSADSLTDDVSPAASQLRDSNGRTKFRKKSQPPPLLIPETNPALRAIPKPQREKVEVSPDEELCMSLLDENVGILQKMQEHLASGRLQENVDLIVKFRRNANKALECTRHMGCADNLPPLPVTMNTSLFSHSPGGTIQMPSSPSMSSQTPSSSSSSGSAGFMFSPSTTVPSTTRVSPATRGGYRFMNTSLF